MHVEPDLYNCTLLTDISTRSVSSIIVWSFVSTVTHAGDIYMDMLELDAATAFKIGDSV